MIFLYGDSHANNSFKNLPISYRNYHQNSVTMFRVGRDKQIINFNREEHNSDSVICIAYGEVDCRCHIQRQINLGRQEDDVIEDLVRNYFDSITHNICKPYRAIIVVAVIPPTRRHDYESLHGPIQHEFPFIGTDEDRVRYTSKVNKKIEEYCTKTGYIYFNPYGHYMRDDGTLRYELSDNIVHLGDNSVFLEEFIKLYSMVC